MSRLPDLAERVERLLQRQDELARANALLQEQLQVLTQERDSLRRISADYRLGVQDLPQGLWVIDRLGGLHANWPAGTRFEPDAR